MSQTASEFAHSINTNSKSSGGWTLTEDADHWASMGIHTGEQLDRYLAINSYTDTYKDINNIKPRWMNWDGVSTEDIKKACQELYAELDAILAADRAEEIRVANIGNPKKTDNGMVWTF